jgi:hypothetical protein
MKLKREFVMRSYLGMLLAIIAVVFTLGCDRKPVETVALDSTLILTDEPSGTVSVAEVLENGQDGDEVTVAGWVAGSQQPIIKGRAAFTIVDLNLPPMECSEIPHSYCCMPKDELLPNMVLVKFVDEEGKTILKDAHGLLGIGEAYTVVVQGRVQCTEEGEVSAILASGLYVLGDSRIVPDEAEVAEDPEQTPTVD